MVVTKARVKGYLIALGVGLATGIVVDTVDLDLVLAKKEKLFSLMGAWCLVTGSVLGAYREQYPPSSPQIQPRRDTPNSQTDTS
jgi:hypothetical protein